MPSSGFESKYAGGYSMEKRKRLESVVIPDKIRCRDCKKLKTAELSFSAKQLLEFKNDVAMHRISLSEQQKAIWVSCKNCIGKQHTEMYCIQCENVKGLDGFTKAQRKTPDMAHCIQCVYENQIATPLAIPGQNELSGRHDEDEYSSEDSDDETNPYCQSELGELDAGVSLSGLSTHRLNDENLKTVPSMTGNVGAWKDYARTACASGDEYTAYDPQGRPHTKVRTPSIAATESSYAPTRAFGVTEREMTKPTSKFSRGGPRVEAPQAPPEYVGGRVVNDDSDAASDDSYGII